MVRSKRNRRARAPAGAGVLVYSSRIHGARKGPDDGSEHRERCPACGGEFDPREFGQLAPHIVPGHAKPLREK